MLIPLLLPLHVHHRSDCWHCSFAAQSPCRNTIKDCRSRKNNCGFFRIRWGWHGRWLHDVIRQELSRISSVQKPSLQISKVVQLANQHLGVEIEVASDSLQHDVDATFKGRDVGHVESEAQSISIHLNPSQSNSIQHVKSDAQANNAVQNHNNQSTTIQYPHPTTVSYKIQQQYPQLWQHPEAIDRTKIADGERFQTEVDIQLLPQTVWKMNEDDIVWLLQLKHQTNQNGYAIYARYETESVLFFDTVEPTDHL